MLKTKNKKNCKAQMKISFNLIFAIILIIIFITFAFFGIKKFIAMQEDIQAKKLVNDIQDEIDEILRTTKSSYEKNFTVPKNIEEIIFEYQPPGLGKPNIYSVPSGVIQANLSGINWFITNHDGEKLSVEVEDRKLWLRFEKDYGEKSVSISKGGEFISEELISESGTYGSGEEVRFEDLTYAVIGDSMSADFSSDWIEDFANKAGLSEEDFEIYANPGDTCAEVYEQLSRVSDGTDILFSTCGVNSLNANTPNTYYYEKIYGKAKEKGISRIYMTTMPPYDELKNNVNGCNKMKSQNQWLMDFASNKEDLEVVDLWSMWHDSTGSSETNCGWNPDKRLSNDGVHPNSYANNLWAEEYYKKVNEYISSLSSGSGSQTEGDNYQNLKTKPRGEFEILYENDFEHRPLGGYSNFNDFREDWNCGGATRWEYSKVVSEIGDNPTKVFQMDYPFYQPEEFHWICWSDSRCDSDDGLGKRKLFDEKPGFGNQQFNNGVGPSSGGGYWEVSVPSRSVLYLSYKFRFGEGFYPVDGGKLPGLCGGHCPGGGGNTDNDGDGTSDGFSARLMFEPAKNEYPISGMFYVYHPDRPGDDSGGYGSGQVFDKGFYDGEWHTVVQRVQMNTLNQENGKLTAWLDGDLVTDKGGYNFRQGDSANFAIDKIMFTTFFGGDGNRLCTESQISSGDFQCGRYNDGTPYYFYAPRKDEYIYFDDVVVYTYSGSYEDGDAWPPNLE